MPTPVVTSVTSPAASISAQQNKRAARPPVGNTPLHLALLEEQRTDTYTEKGDLACAARVLGISVEAWAKIENKSGTHALYKASMTKNTYYLKSYRDRPKKEPHNNEAQNIHRAYKLGYAQEIIPDPTLMVRNVSVVPEIEGKYFSREDMQEPATMRKVAKLLRDVHMREKKVTDQGPENFIRGGVNRIKTLQEKPISTPIDLTSLHNRMLWIQAELDKYQFPRIFAVYNVHPRGIWETPDGELLLTAHESDRVTSGWHVLGRLEYTSVWTVEETDTIVLPVYLGKAPTDEDKQKMRLIRAAMNCDYFGYHCELDNAKSVKGMLKRLDADKAHIPELPALKGNLEQSAASV